MLSELSIRDFILVPHLELALKSGLTVFTGETGAGKSILVDALSLALGGRAETTVIRHGCVRAEVSASFTLKINSEAAAWLKAQDLLQDNECLLRRVVELEKGSKAYINGRPVTLQMLRELGELLVDIHGQNEHQSLLKRPTQRQILDRFAGLEPTVAHLAQNYAAVKSLETRVATLKNQAAERAARIDLLRYQAQELETLNISLVELTQLAEEHPRLANGAELIEGLQQTLHFLCEAEDGAVTHLLAQTTHRLEALQRFAPKLESITQMLNEAMIQIEEAATELRHYADGFELDPQRLQWIDQRLASVHELARKHQVSPKELPSLTERLLKELKEFESFDSDIIHLQQEMIQLKNNYLKVAQEISKKRQAAAARLGREVTKAMQGLGMQGGHFEVVLTALGTDDISAHGLEQIDFLVSANPGQPLKPLNKVASGGELSRISLALQVITADTGQIPTLVFDEVDVGIGGGVAEIVGQQLRTLGTSRQVFCITHLAQVAAQGQHHLQVSKFSENGTTSAHINVLEKNARVTEIARMLGGVEISKQTLAHAKEMLAHAI